MIFWLTHICVGVTSRLLFTLPVNFTYDVGLVYSDKDCKVKAGKNFVGEFRLTKPVGVCTTNVRWSGGHGGVVCTRGMMGNGYVRTYALLL